jgi:hypothetical protein
LGGLLRLLGKVVAHFLYHCARAPCLKCNERLMLHPGIEAMPGQQPEMVGQGIG